MQAHKILTRMQFYSLPSIGDKYYYLKSLCYQDYRVLVADISTAPRLTAFDIQLMMSYSADRRLTYIDLPSISEFRSWLNGELGSMAFFFRLFHITGLRKLDLTIEEAQRYFEFGIFRDHKCVNSWQLEDAHSAAGMWLTGAPIHEMLLTYTSLTVHVTPAALKAYFAALPDEVLFVNNRRIFSYLANSYFKGIDASNKRVVAYIGELHNRMLDFAPFNIAGLPVWCFYHYIMVRRIVPDDIMTKIGYGINKILPNFMDQESYPRYHARHFSLLPPPVQATLKILGQLFRGRSKTTIRTVLFDHVMTVMYAEITEKLKNISRLGNIYRTDFSPSTVTIYTWDIWNPVGGAAAENLRPLVLAAHHLDVSFSKQVLNLYEWSNAKFYAAFDALGLGRWKTLAGANFEQKRQLLIQCFTNQLAMSLICLDMIKLTADFQVVNVDSARQLTNHYHLRNKTRAQQCLLDGYIERKRVKVN